MKNLKAGFTLVELMVFFMFISLILAASTPIITKRVKNIPEKVSHGKYLCYRDERGNLRQAYYNSTSLIKDEPVESCSFEPPRKAALYKIEIVGAGAGGTQYKGVIQKGDNWLDEDNIYEAYYNVKTQKIDGSYYKKPSSTVLRHLLLYATYQIKAYVPKGGDGGRIDVTYTPVARFTLRVINTGTLDCYSFPDTCDEHPEYKVAFYDVVNRIGTEFQNEYYYCDNKGDGEYCYGRYQDECYRPLFSELSSSIVNSDNLLKQALDNLGTKRYRNLPKFEIERVTTSATQHGYGEQGGYGGILWLKGKMDFKDINGNNVLSSKLEEYFNNLFNGVYIKKGTWTATAGFDESGYPQANGTNGQDRQYRVSEGIKSAGAGGSIDKYTAIKFFNNTIITNEKNAEGGDGGYIKLPDGQLIVSQIGRQADSAEGAEFQRNIDGNFSNHYGIQKGFNEQEGLTSSSVSDIIPRVHLETNLNKRVHKVGHGGYAGEVKTFYAPALANDCSFNVPVGGVSYSLENVISDNPVLEETTLSCNDNKLNFSAKAGTYSQDTTQQEHTFEYCLNGDGSCDAPEALTTFSQGEMSNYHPSNVFTDLDISDANSGNGFGSGGDSETIEDKCVYPSGYYKYSLVSPFDTNRQPEQQAFDYEPCNIVEQVSVKSPTGGRGGAIIISW